MLRAKDLTFAYPDSADILSGISLTLERGDRIAIAGDNGSGKTTLARLLCGLLEPTGGVVEVDGLDTRNPETIYDVRRRVGIVFQDPDDQLVEMIVEREIGFGLRNLGFDASEVCRRVEDALEVFGIRHLRKRPCHLLSAGEKQTVTVASIFAMQPHYIILDESTSLLDNVSRHRILGAVQRLLEETRAGLVFISMRIEDIWFCPRVIFLRGGTADFEGSRGEFFEYVRTLGLPLHGLPLLVSELEEFVPDLVRRLDESSGFSADSLSHVLVGLRESGIGGQDCRY